MNYLSRQPLHSGRCGALLQLMVFDCPISSTFPLPLSPHSRRCHIQQSCRTSHPLSLHFRSILFVSPTPTIPWHVLVQKSSPSRDCPFLRAPAAFNVPHYRSTCSDSLASTPYVAYTLILSHALAIRMVGTSSLNRSDRLWTVGDAYTPQFPPRIFCSPIS
jgi:hypothetical protein